MVSERPRGSSRRRRRSRRHGKEGAKLRSLHFILALTVVALLVHLVFLQPTQMSKANRYTVGGSSTVSSALPPGVNIDMIQAQLANPQMRNMIGGTMDQEQLKMLLKRAKVAGVAQARR